jgi:hypothetical protein
VNSIKAAVVASAIMVLAACGGGGGGGGSGNGGGGGSGNGGGSNGAPTFSVGGSVAGLNGSGLTLSSNGQTLAVAANGSFTFASSIAGGSAYNVAVAVQPSAPTQTCTVANGNGTLSANVTNVAVSCVTSTFTLGGTVTGLTGSGLTLSSNGQSLVVGAAGAFAFPEPIASGATYQVTVASQPESPAQECGVSNGAGTLTNANIDSIAVTCASLLPLALTDSTPSDRASDVARDNALVLNFSSALNAATVNTNTVTLGNSVAGRQEIDVATSGSRVTITPRRKLLPAALYTITIDAAVRGSRDQGMTAPATVSFTTREASWLASRYIEDLATSVRNPEVAASGNTVVAVWEEQDLGVGVNRYEPRTGWGAHQSFPSGAGSNNPQVVVDSQGVGHIAWTRYQNPATNLESVRYSAADSFGAMQLAENDDVSSVSRAQLAIDGQDQVFALWRYGSGTSSSDGTVFSNRYSAGSGWGDVLARLDGTPRGIKDPRIAVNRAGNAFATWTQTDPTGRSRIFANRSVSREWGFPVRVDNVAATSNAIDSHVAIDAAGNALAIYRFEVTASDDAIGASRYTVGAGWSTPVTFDSSNSEIDEAQLAVDPAGNALAVWIEDGATKHIWANRYTVGSGWGAAERIAVATSSTEGVQVAMDAAGNAIAVWMQYAPNVENSAEIMAIRYVAGAGWGVARSIDNETDDVIDPHPVFDASGDAVVVWISFDGSVNNIRANRFE